MYIPTAPAAVAGTSVLAYELVSSTTDARSANPWSLVLIGLALLCLLYAFVVQAARRQRR